MKLRPITDIEKIGNEEIRRGAKDGSKAVVTRHFVAVENHEEVAFVSLDIFPPSQQPLCLYTLVVPKLLRRKGIGSRVLVEVERQAVKWGYDKVLLRPEPLDNTWSKEDLEHWYSKRGYTPPDPERPDVWTKSIAGKRRKMTEKELQRVFREFNKRYFGDALASKLVVTEDWVDATGNYYPDAVVSGADLLTGTVNGTVVSRATATYTHAEDTIRIPRTLIKGEKATKGLLLHEMAHAAANEPETEHGPKWHGEMKRLYRAEAPINLHDVTPGYTTHALVGQYGVGSEFWNQP